MATNSKQAYLLRQQFRQQQEQIDGKVDAPLPEAFPVGAVFISVVADDPADLLGYGTWSSFGAGRVLVGLDSGNPDFDTVEETGGSDTSTPEGSVSQPTFTGDALGTHSHGTGTYAVGNHSFTQPTISWPAGVPTAANESSHTHSVTSNVTVADHSAHTHSVTSNVAVANHASHTHTYSQVINHTHTVTGVGSSASGGTANLTGANDASSTTATAANPAGGVAQGTTDGPNATLTHSVTNNEVTSGNPSATLTHTPTNNAVTSGTGSAHSHTLSWPAGVPTAAGGAVDAHSVSGSSQAISAGTPAGTVSTPTFTGDSLSVVQPYIVVYFWKRTA